VTRARLAKIISWNKYNLRATNSLQQGFSHVIQSDSKVGMKDKVASIKVLKRKG
ncbi:MAG: hypothetical protein JWQ25_2834, partial [Daejeonella sp.]|nr:hypothetical protein [Daejeonella sp.]